MSDLDSLLSAIRAEPQEDTVRLALADLLDERMPEMAARAEFIRVQIELAKWSCNFKQTKEQPGWHHDCGTDANGYWLCQPLRSRERESWIAGACHSVLDAFKPTFPECVAHLDCDYPDYVPRKPEAYVRRGFLSRIRCSWPDAAAHLDSILADPWTPGLDEVELTTWPPVPWEGEAPRLAEARVRGTLAFLRCSWPKEKVRSWKLPPEPREPLVDMPYEPELDLLNPDACDCPRCDPSRYSACVRCGRLERHDRQHACRARMLVEDEFPCRRIFLPSEES